MELTKELMQKIYDKRVILSDTDSLWLCLLIEKVREQQENIERFERWYENTGAMFNRMTMKEKIERYEKTLKECIEQDGLMEFLDKNEWATQEDYFVKIAKEALYG